MPIFLDGFAVFFWVLLDQLALVIADVGFASDRIKHRARLAPFPHSSTGGCGNWNDPAVSSEKRNGVTLVVLFGVAVGLALFSFSGCHGALAGFFSLGSFLF